MSSSSNNNLAIFAQGYKAFSRKSLLSHQDFPDHPRVKPDQASRAASAPQLVENNTSTKVDKANLLLTSAVMRSKFFKNDTKEPSINQDTSHLKVSDLSSTPPEYASKDIPSSSISPPPSYEECNASPPPVVVDNQSTNDDEIANIYNITWHGGVLGIVLKEGSNGSIVIRRLNLKRGESQGLTAAATGDSLERINDASTDGMGFENVVKRLRKADYPITLTFAKPLGSKSELNPVKSSIQAVTSNVVVSSATVAPEPPSTEATIATAAAVAPVPPLNVEAAHVEGSPMTSPQAVAVPPVLEISSVKPEETSTPLKPIAALSVKDPSEVFRTSHVSVSQEEEYNVQWVDGSLGVTLKDVDRSYPVVSRLNEPSRFGICENDTLLAINGSCAAEMDFTQIMQLLKYSDKPISLTFKRQQTKINVLHSSTSSASSSSSSTSQKEVPISPPQTSPEESLPKNYTVSWSNGPLGIALRENEDGNVYVARLTGKGLSARSSILLVEGDYLVNVAGISVSDLGFKQSVHFLKSVKKPVHLEFERQSETSEEVPRIRRLTTGNVRPIGENIESSNSNGSSVSTREADLVQSRHTEPAFSHRELLLPPADGFRTPPTLVSRMSTKGEDLYSAEIGTPPEDDGEEEDDEFPDFPDIVRDSFSDDAAFSDLDDTPYYDSRVFSTVTQGAAAGTESVVVPAASTDRPFLLSREESVNSAASFFSEDESFRRSNSFAIDDDDDDNSQQVVSSFPVDLVLEWSSGPLGMTLKRCPSGKVKISRLTGRGTTPGLNKLVSGDYMVAVGDTRCANIGFEETMNVLKTSAKPLSLSFEYARLTRKPQEHKGKTNVTCRTRKKIKKKIQASPNNSFEKFFEISKKAQAHIDTITSLQESSNEIKQKEIPTKVAELKKTLAQAICEKSSLSSTLEIRRRQSEVDASNAEISARKQIERLTAVIRDNEASYVAKCAQVKKLSAQVEALRLSDALIVKHIQERIDSSTDLGSINLDNMEDIISMIVASYDNPRNDSDSKKQLKLEKEAHNVTKKKLKSIVDELVLQSKKNHLIKSEKDPEDLIKRIFQHIDSHNLTPKVEFLMLELERERAANEDLQLQLRKVDKKVNATRVSEQSILPA